METKKQHLIVKNIIGSDLAVSSDDGKKIYQAIFEALRREAIVELDFQGITILTMMKNLKKFETNIKNI